MSMPKIEPSNICICQAIGALVQSIALEETAISHVINAEGEKIQKVIAMESNCIEDLLKINSSVESLLETITSLEVVLKSKLDSILPVLEDCVKCDECDECRKPCKICKPF